MSPSIDTLGGILDALGTTFAAFFADLQIIAPSSPFYAAADLVEIGNADGISYRMVGMGHPNRRMMLLSETYAVGAHTGRALSHEAQEAGIVTKGEIELTVGGAKRLLRRGDGYYFDSSTPHHFRNAAREVSEVISAVTPPTY